MDREKEKKKGGRNDQKRGRKKTQPSFFHIQAKYSMEQKRGNTGAKKKKKERGLKKKGSH